MKLDDPSPIPVSRWSVPKDQVRDLPTWCFLWLEKERVTVP